MIRKIIQGIVLALILVTWCEIAWDWYSGVPADWTTRLLALFCVTEVACNQVRNLLDA